MIEVRLFANFRDGRQNTALLDAGNFQNVSAVLEHFHIPDEEVAICLINGRHSKTDSVIKDGDVLALFPPVGGG